MVWPDPICASTFTASLDTEYRNLRLKPHLGIAMDVCPRTSQSPRTYRIRPGAARRNIDKTTMPNYPGSIASKISPELSTGMIVPINQEPYVVQ